MAESIDAYLDLQKAGIKGEANNSGVVGTIPLLGYSFGTSTVAHANFGSGSSGAVKSEIHPLTVTYPVNSASPGIWIKSLVNEHFNATLYVRKSTGANQPSTFLQLDLEQAMITSVSTSGSAADAAIPMETLTIVPAKVTYTYTTQQTDGSMGTQTQYAYDQRLSQQV
jgi:type VI protein secretion system component Hcp